MRVAPKEALKAIPLAALGCAAALLVACGDRNGLLSSRDAADLQNALANVQAACAAGQGADAAAAARQFSDRVAELSPRQVDRRLIADLAAGASTLDTLVARTCTATTPATIPTATTPTTTTGTTTTATTPTTTTEPTTPATTPTTTTPSNGGGSPGEGNGPPGGVPPGQQKNGGAGGPGGEGAG